MSSIYPKHYWTHEKDTGALRTIECEHSHLHEGLVFRASQINLALANNGAMLFEWTVPAKITMHLKTTAVFCTGVPFKLEGFENPILTTGTNAIIPRNRKRVSGAPASQIVMKSNPIVTDPGDLNIETLFGGSNGVGHSRAGGGSTSVWEWELGAGLYLLRITNLTGDAQIVSAEMNWYELSEED